MSDLPVFLLEDEDCNELFITQEAKESDGDVVFDENYQDTSILGIDGHDFSSPNVSVVRGLNAVYSDISDSEDFEKPMELIEKIGDDVVDVTNAMGNMSSQRAVGRGITRMFGLHSRKWFGNKPTQVATSKTVSRKFHNISEAKLSELQTRTIKKRSYSKMMWGVRAYNDWRSNRLSDSVNYDVNIFEANLQDLKMLSKENFEYAMCQFIPEIRKVKDGSDYPGATLYQLCVSIQQFLNENGKDWKIVDGPDFKQLRIVLDNVMKERAKMNIGMVKRQANVIPYNFENTLWERGILGEDTPDKLRSTVLLLLGINLGLRAVDEHKNLRRHSEDRESQLTFRYNEKGVRCLIYQEDSVNKTNDGGLKQFRKQRKIVWVYPSSNINRCPVHLVDKYMSLCPPVVKGSGKDSLYLHSLNKTNPGQWYSCRVLGVNTLKSVVKEMLKDAQLDRFFTNHSLRRSSTSRLFQAGVDRKLVKEFTGHVSDAVDQYQITSDAQREKMSDIIKGIDEDSAVVELKNDKKSESVNKQKETKTSNTCDSLEISIKDTSKGNDLGCTCKRTHVNVEETSGIAQLLTDILRARHSGKVCVEIEIDLNDSK